MSVYKRSIWVAMGWLAGAMVLSSAERTIDFTGIPINEPPAGFRAVLGGSGAAGDWRVIEAEVPSALPSLTGQSSRKANRRALAQLSRDPVDERFPMLLYDGEIYGDFTATVQIKMLEGEKEQMAGLAFRVQDEKNYYYVRASALGGSLYFFKVVGGVRSAPIGSRIEIPRGVWHELKIECRGNKIRVGFNGKEAIPELTDKSFTRGKIGFWTKSDSLSHFANLHLNYTPLEILAQALLRDAMAKYTRVEKMKIFSTGTNDPTIKVVAASNPEDLGALGGKVEQDVLERSKVYHSKIDRTVTMTMPMHDANGDTVAAVMLVMKSFPGETEKTAVTRAIPIIKLMEDRVRSHTDLLN
ncbi:MAG: DUF1080 domain-containing protein [Verrucomicrobiales bacterium]|nr:DUF1080 domain-containing protein [Verrucomicrobiales bacterium]